MLQRDDGSSMIAPYKSFCHFRPKLIYEIICVYEKYAEKGERNGEIQIWEETYGGSPEI